MPSEHARFSPSAANRRIHCPPSLLLEEQFEEGESMYAAEGTAGHALAEHLIRKYLKKRTTRPTSDFYTDELVEAVDEYVSFVIAEIEDARRICEHPIIIVEQRVDALRPFSAICCVHERFSSSRNAFRYNRSTASATDFKESSSVSTPSASA